MEFIERTASKRYPFHFETLLITKNLHTYRFHRRSSYIMQKSGNLLDRDKNNGKAAVHVISRIA